MTKKKALGPPKGIVYRNRQPLDATTGQMLVKCVPCSSTGSIRGVANSVYENPCQQCTGHGYCRIENYNK